MQDKDCPIINFQRLACAVLERAILDLISLNKNEVKEALIWLKAPLDPYTPAPFTFSWVCIQLNIEAHTLQKKLFHSPLLDQIKSVHPLAGKGRSLVTYNIFNRIFEDTPQGEDRYSFTHKLQGQS